jgi:uncharacterized DUF497 family protein
MEISFDPAKNAKNIAMGRPSFEAVAGFDFQTAFFWIDDRKDYGETRWSGLGFVGERLHALIFAETASGIRVISFRKANKREVRRYEHAINP